MCIQRFRRLRRHTGLLLLLTMLAGCGGEAPSFAGEYSGKGLSVSLRADGEGYVGSIRMGGKAFAASGKAQGLLLVGDFRDGAAGFAFTLRRKGDAFELSSGGSKYELQRKVPANPLAKPAVNRAGQQEKAPVNPLAMGPGTQADAGKSHGSERPQQSGQRKQARAGAETGPAKTAIAGGPRGTAVGDVAKATAAGKVAVNGAVYRHPLGVRFRYPQGWRLQEVQDSVLSLLPSDALRNEKGPLELYFVVGDSAQGLSSAADPQVGQFLGQMLAVFRFLSPDGASKSLEIHGRAHSIYEWKGKNPDGQSFRARAYATILDGFALAVIGVAPEARLATRDPILKAIAGSFFFKAPPVRKSLVGNWVSESHYSSGSGYSGTTQRYLQLRSDGTCYWSSRAFALMTNKDSKGEYSSTRIRDTGIPKDASRGRWSCKGSSMRIYWDSGESTAYSWEQDGSSLLLINKKSGDKRLWTR